MRRRWTAGGNSGTAAPPLEDGVTQEGRLCARMEKCVQAVRMLWRENPGAQSLSGDGERNQVAKWLGPYCQEKPLTMGVR